MTHLPLRQHIRGKTLQLLTKFDLQNLQTDQNPCRALYSEIFRLFCAWRFTFILIFRLALRSGSTRTLIFSARLRFSRRFFTSCRTELYTCTNFPTPITSLTWFSTSSPIVFNSSANRHWQRQSVMNLPCYQRWTRVCQNSLQNMRTEKNLGNPWSKPFSLQKFVSVKVTSMNYTIFPRLRSLTRHSLCRWSFSNLEQWHKHTPQVGINPFCTKPWSHGSKPL